MNKVFVCSNSVHEQIYHVQKIYIALAKSCITLKMNKCALFINKVEYLGYFIRPGQLEVNHSYISSLSQPDPPTTKS